MSNVLSPSRDQVSRPDNMDETVLHTPLCLRKFGCIDSFYKNNMYSKGVKELSLVVGKPVFGVSDLIRHKPRCATTQDG